MGGSTMKLLMVLVLIGACTKAVPKTKETYYRLLGSEIKCKTMTITNPVSLKDCTNGVKEIYNATNILFYE